MAGASGSGVWPPAGGLGVDAGADAEGWWEADEGELEDACTFAVADSEHLASPEGDGELVDHWPPHAPRFSGFDNDDDGDLGLDAPPEAFADAPPFDWDEDEEVPLGVSGIMSDSVCAKMSVTKN